MRRIFFALLLCLTPSLALAEVRLDLTAQEQAWIRERIGPLRVHNELDWPPYNFNENGQAKGYSVDYMNLLAAKLGLKVEYVSGPNWNQFLDMMKGRSLDVMLNIANTRDRREYLAFTEPYYITSVGLYVRKDENRIADLSDMAGKRLAFPTGFFFEEFIRKYYPEIKLVTFDSAPATFRGVADGKADAAMDTLGVARRVLQEEKLSTLKFGGKVSDPRFITTFSIATRSDNIMLRNILQKGMDAILPAEELELGRKWNLKDSAGEDPAPLPADDAAYLQRAGRLRYCINPNLLPLEALTLDGAHTGVSSEFMKMLSEKLGLPMQMVPARSWEESKILVKRRQCDLLPMAVKSQETEGGIRLTAPWLSPELVIATGHDQIYVPDIKQIGERKIGVARNSQVLGILKAAYPQLDIVETDDVAAGLKAVEKGRLFGFVDILPVIGRTLEADAIKGVKISGSIGLKADFALGVRDDDPRLAAILERTAAALDKGAIESVYKRWLAVAYVERVDYGYLWQVLAGVFAAGLFVLYQYNKSLRVTATLRAAHANVEAANLRLDEQNQILDRLARTDSLTGLLNRHAIDEHLNEEWRRFQRYGAPFSVILLDIDHFKAINDSLGHQAGDQALKQLAATLKQHTRESDLIGRWGGEEFLILCPSTPLEGATRLAELLRIELPKSANYENHRLTASFGVAMAGADETADQLVRRADDMLYQAKKGGRDQVAA